MQALQLQQVKCQHACNNLATKQTWQRRGSRQNAVRFNADPAFKKRCVTSFRQLVARTVLETWQICGLTEANAKAHETEPKHIQMGKVS